MYAVWNIFAIIVRDRLRLFAQKFVIELLECAKRALIQSLLQSHIPVITGSVWEPKTCDYEIIAFLRTACMQMLSACRDLTPVQ